MAGELIKTEGLDVAERIARGIVSRLLQKTSIRMGLIQTPKGDRRLYVHADPRATIPALYDAAARAGGAVPKLSKLAHIKRVAQGYLEAQKEAAVAAVSRVVSGVVGAADVTSRLMPDQVRRDLAAAVGAVLDRLRPAVERIVSTEAVAARNIGSLEVVQRQGQQAGQMDPAMYWIVVRDGKACGRCRRAHLLEDGVTPRVWRLSEVSQAYARGDGRPSVFGQHPRCRCQPASLLPGYGFNSFGMLEYKTAGHDELAVQREGKS